jgi:hypothetical protein
MAVTAGGTPYVEASDLVADYPATSLALANKVDTKLDNAPTDNAQSGATYTFVLADARQLVSATNASAKTFTIPPQSSVTWVAGTMLRVVNYGAGALTVNGGAGVTVTNTASTLAQYQAATAIRTGSNAWTLVPFSGGAGNADFSNTATGTYSSGGINYKYVTFTGSGTLTVTKSGLADILVVGGGGGAVLGGGGGGGVLYATDAYLTAGSVTVTVGAGGAAYGYNGISSRVGSFYGVGGGGQNYYHTDGTASRHNGQPGGSGGGSGTTVAGSFGTGLSGQGNDGGIRVDTGMGGGGGAGAIGSNGSGTTGGNGGVGISNSITNTAVLYGPGGGGGGSVTGGTGGLTGGGNGNTTTGATAGTANTGGGGGGGNSPGGKAGGSGIVIVRVKV